MTTNDTSQNGTITDLNERTRALDPSVSFIVQAPAGSGKTGLLMQRYLKLLALCEMPENILAMTFTKKAAAEMRTRILSAIETARESNRPDNDHDAATYDLARAVIEADKKRGWNLALDPGRLKIRTFDSFCASIVRQSPLSASIVAADLTDNADELYREAALGTVKLIEADTEQSLVVKAALEHMDNSIVALTKRITEMLNKRDQWLRHIRLNAGEEQALRARFEENLKKVVDSELQTIKDAIDDELRAHLPMLARFAAQKLIEEGSTSRITSLSGLKDMPPPVSDDLDRWKAIADLLLTKKDGKWLKKIDKTIGFPATKDDESVEYKKCIKGHLSRLEAMPERAALLHRVRSLPSPAYSDEEWATLASMIKLLPIAAARLNEIFSSLGVIDFQQNSINAISALSEPENGRGVEDILLKLDMSLRHILVDEFQDTSYAQELLLRKLTGGWEPGDGRTLFLVGDPMQSIFLFREATVGIYLKARTSGIGNVKLEPITLKTNFRAQENIVKWVNDTLKNAFAGADDADTGATAYAPSSAVKPAIDKVLPVLDIYLNRDDESEARRIISITKELPPDEHTAILCRARSHLLIIVEHLKINNINFRARGFDPLSGRVVIKDLLALYRALMHPFDRIAWLSILRAPWAGVILSDIHKLCLNAPEAPVIALMHDEERLTRLSADGAKRIKSMRPILAKANELRGRTSPARLVEGAWIALGGPACLESPMDSDDANMFFDSLSKASVGGSISRLITDMEERLNKLYAPHGKIDSKVEILTIHDAKGLEFDNVIIPGVGRKPKNNDKELILWAETADDLIVAPVEARNSKDKSDAYNYLHLLKKDKFANEISRLFYVAVTRAKKRLYISGHVKDKIGAFSTGKGSFLSLIESILETNAMLQAKSPGSDALQNNVLQNSLRRLKSDYNIPAPLDAVAHEARIKDKADDSRPEFYWAGEYSRLTGTVTHELLCRIGRDGLENWSLKRIEENTPGIVSRLKGLGLGVAQAKEQSIVVKEILTRAINDKTLGQKLLKRRQIEANELAITAISGKDIKRYSIDRTYVDEHGVRWIIDFKTGSHEGGSIEAFLESEKARYHSQLQGYEAALRAAGETRPIKKGLYYPALGRFIEC